MDDSKIIRTKSGFSIGTLKGNIFRKRVRGAKHLFRKLDAWGIDYDILYGELPDKCVVRILDQDDDAIYQVTTKVWKEHGTVLHFKEGTQDHNVQVFLPRKFFDRVPGRG